jgi:hypothetical protein
MPFWNGTIIRIRELVRDITLARTLRLPVDHTSFTAAKYIELGDLMDALAAADLIRCVKDYPINTPNVGVKIMFSSDFGTTNYVTTMLQCIGQGGGLVIPTSYQEYSDGVTITVDEKCSVSLCCIKVI